jgi:hypothetical protein
VRAAARRAGISWATWNAIELGSPRTTLAKLCAVGDAIGLDLVLQAYPGRPPSLRDSGQLAIAQALMAVAHGSIQPRIELLVGKNGRAIDLVLFSPVEIVAIEIERMAVDFQAQLRRADEKRSALAERHHRPVRLVLAVEDTRKNRAVVGPHLDLIRRALPAGSREVLAAIRAGRALGRDGLLWVRRRRLRG